MKRKNKKVSTGGAVVEIVSKGRGVVVVVVGGAADVGGATARLAEDGGGEGHKSSGVCACSLGVQSPQRGKLGGGLGICSGSPTWITIVIPISMWKAI